MRLEMNSNLKVYGCTYEVDAQCLVLWPSKKGARAPSVRTTSVCPRDKVLFAVRVHVVTNR